MFNDRQRYKLFSPFGNLPLERDPMGWENSETDIKRSEKTFGIFLTISNNLEFTGKAKEFLENNYKLYGVMAEVRLTKEVKHPKTDEWQLVYDGYLDFTTRNIEDNKFKIDFIEGGLRELLTSQMKEKFELNRATDIKGRPISPLNPDLLSLEKGREIYLLSRLSSEGTDSFVLRSGNWDSGEDFRDSHRPAPMAVVANSDPENINNPLDVVNHHEGYDENLAGCFFLIADRDRGKTRLKINLGFTIDHISQEGAQNTSFDVFLRRYEKVGEDNFVKLGEDVFLVNTLDPRDNSGASFSEELNLEFDPANGTGIKEGESFALYFRSNGRYNGEPTGNGWMDVHISNYSGSIRWEEDSNFRPTTADFITAYEAGQRFTEIYSGKPAFRSKLLTETWPDLGFTCGFWLRNMKKSDEEPRTMTMKFEDYYKSIHAVEPVGYGIVTEGNRQYIALEKMRYFFQPYTTIRLGKVSNIKRQTASEFAYSAIDTGYTKGGGYEKPLGLDEYNIQAHYITPITKTTNRYEAYGESRADGYAVEQARRMQMEDYPDEDTPYDKDNFLIDAKVLQERRGKTDYAVRTWQDDFESAPVGVYSPDTAFNLRITPAHNRNRHAYWFNAALVKYPEDKIRYAHNEGNNELETTLIGKDPVKENEDVLIGGLSNPIFDPEWVNFELDFSQELMDQITGTTKIGEEYINNFYGLVEYLNEENRKEKAYLFSATIKDKITIKGLKAYGY